MGILEHSFCIVNQLSFILKVKFEAFMCISCFYTHHLCQEKFFQMWPPVPDSAAKSPNRWRNEILSEGQKSWKFQEKRKMALSFILTEKREFWSVTPLPAYPSYPEKLAQAIILPFSRIFLRSESNYLYDVLTMMTDFAYITKPRGHITHGIFFFLKLASIYFSSTKKASSTNTIYKLYNHSGF